VSTYRKGQKIRVASGSIQRSTGAAWAGDRGEVVEVTGDGYKVRFDSGFVADNVRDNEIKQA
jgi:ribosomal protein L21E